MSCSCIGVFRHIFAPITVRSLRLRRCVSGYLGGVTTPFIEPGSPWENGYVESFNGKLRDELLNGEIFYTLKEAKVVIERWRQEFNRLRPHSSLSYRPPAPETIWLKPAPLHSAGFNQPLSAPSY